MPGKKVEEPEPLGWDAIDGALRKVYGDTEPHRWVGGNDPLGGTHAYRSEFGGRAHWHFVTFGNSGPSAKASDPGGSGFGYEMTIRVVDPEATMEPPEWVPSLLQILARYVVRTRNPFGDGHTVPLNGPMVLGRSTLLEAAAFVTDPQLAAIDTPRGRVEFIQFVGLTSDELDASKAWDVLRLLDLFAEHDPALLTDLSRGSYLANPEIQRRLEEGIAKDGSSMDSLCLKDGCFLAARGGPAVLGVTANAIGDLKRIVSGRLEFGRLAIIEWPGGSVRLSPGARTAVVFEQSLPVGLSLEPVDREAVHDVPAKRGDYPLPSGRAVIRVIPFDVIDRERNRVVRTIG
ncbi:MAG: suppressor of fused domain protein [Myxococcales bacterium]